MAGNKWYVDLDESLWRLSKAIGGVQCENEDGSFGKPMVLFSAEEQFGIKLIDEHVGLVLDAFDTTRPPVHDIDAVQKWFKLRKSVVEVVQGFKQQNQELRAVMGELPAGGSADDTVHLVDPDKD